MKKEYPIFERFLNFTYADLLTMADDDRLRLASRTYLDSIGFSRLLEGERGNFLIESMKHDENVRIFNKNIKETQAHVLNLINLLFYAVHTQELLRKLDKMEKDKQDIEVGKTEKEGIKQYSPISIWDVESKVKLSCEIEGTGLLATNSEDIAGFNVSSGNRRFITRLKIVKMPFWKDLEYNLYLSIDGMPIKALRRCPECDHVFVHMSKKKRIYCTNRCAAKVGIRRNRKKDKAIKFKQGKDGLKKGCHSYT